MSLIADTLQNMVVSDTSFDGFSRSQVSMVVSNPHLDDNPIIYVNHAFSRQTGYARSAVIGRNCRFLQGDDTSKDAVDLIRIGVAGQEPVTVDILNYRASGEVSIFRTAPEFAEIGSVRDA